MHTYKTAIVSIALLVVVSFFFQGIWAWGVVSAVVLLAFALAMKWSYDQKHARVSCAGKIGMYNAGNGWSITPADKNSVYVYLHGKPTGLLRRTEIERGLSHNTPDAPDYQETNQLLNAALKVLGDYNQPTCHRA